MTNLSDFFLDKTASGTAVASDINTGKIAWVDGAPLTGTASIKPLPEQYGYRMLHINPTNNAQSGYNPVTGSPNGKIITDTAMTSFYGASDWVLDADGYSNNSTSFANFLVCSGVMPAYTTARRYRLWGKTKDATLTTGYGCRVMFGDTNPSTDTWLVQLKWDNAATRYYLELREVTASVNTLRASVNFGATLAVPARWAIEVIEEGDNVYAMAFLHEIDSYTHVEAQAISYSVASRPRKTVYTWRMSTVSTPGDQWLIRGASIDDLL